MASDMTHQTEAATTPKLDRFVRSKLAYAVLALITLIAALPGVFAMPALDRDESRFAQASKQMLETGDYIRIREQEGLRNKKPAGIHWLQAGSTALTSSAEAKQIWSYRLPSMIGAAIAAMLVFWAGQPLIGRRAAFLGALAFAPSLLLTTEAHISKTDAVLAALTIWSMGLLARLYLANADKIAAERRLALAFWGANGLAFLIKGPVTPLVCLLTGLALVLWDRQWRWLKPLAQWQGPALFVLLVLPWFIWVQIATSGAFLEGAVGKDLKDKVVGASEGHGGLPGYHLMFLPTHFFPATLILFPGLVLGVRRLWRAGRGSETVQGLRFLFAWLVPTWLFWEILPTKLSHYILPAYPALALIAGWGALKLIEGARAPISRWASVALFALGALALTLLDSEFGIQLVKQGPADDFSTLSQEAVLAAWDTGKAAAIWMPLIALAGLVAVVALAIVKRHLAMLGVAALTAMGLGWHLRTITLPAQTWIQPTTTARLALAEVCALPDRNPETCTGEAPQRVRAVYYSEPSLVFTTGTDTTITSDRSGDNTVLSVRDPAQPEAVIAFLVNTEDKGNAAHNGLSGADALKQILGDADAEGCDVRQSAAYPALNYSNGNPVVFVALRIEGCG